MCGEAGWAKPEGVKVSRPRSMAKAAGKPESRRPKAEGKPKSETLGGGQGCLKLGPRAVPARSAQKHLRWLRRPESPGAVGAAASRDGLRSDPELDGGLRSCRQC